MIPADDLTAPLFGALSFRRRFPRLSAQYVARIPVGDKKKSREFRILYIWPYFGYRSTLSQVLCGVNFRETYCIRMEVFST